MDLFDFSVKETEIFEKIHEISIKYNMDKKNIIQTYLNFIIREKLSHAKPESDENSDNESGMVFKRNHLYGLSTAKLTEFFKLMENIIHITDMPIEIIVKYFSYNIKKFYSTISEK